MARDWEKVKEDFLTGISFKELAKKYGLRVETVRRRAEKEAWAKKGAADSSRDITAEHRLLWKDVKKKLRRGLERGDIEELKVAKVAGDVLVSVVKGERQAWGLEEGDGELTDEEEIVREMACLTVPPGTDETMDGG